MMHCETCETSRRYVRQGVTWLDRLDEWQHRAFCRFGLGYWWYSLFRPLCDLREARLQREAERAVEAATATFTMPVPDGYCVREVRLERIGAADTVTITQEQLTAARQDAGGDLDIDAEMFSYLRRITGADEVTP